MYTCGITRTTPPPTCRHLHQLRRAAAAADRQGPHRQVRAQRHRRRRSVVQASSPAGALPRPRGAGGGGVFERDMVAPQSRHGAQLATCLQRHPRHPGLHRHGARAGSPTRPAQRCTDVSKFPSFGTVSHYTEQQMLEYARERGGQVDDPRKRHPLDFVLGAPSRSPTNPAGHHAVFRPALQTIECSALGAARTG